MPREPTAEASVKRKRNTTTAGKKAAKRLAFVEPDTDEELGTAARLEPEELDAGVVHEYAVVDAVVLLTSVGLEPDVVREHAVVDTVAPLDSVKKKASIARRKLGPCCAKGGSRQGTV